MIHGKLFFNKPLGLLLEGLQSSEEFNIDEYISYIKISDFLYI